MTHYGLQANRGGWRARLAARLGLAVRLRTLAVAEVRPGRLLSAKSARELSDDEIVKVLTREAKKAPRGGWGFADAGHTEQAERPPDGVTPPAVKAAGAECGSDTSEVSAGFITEPNDGSP